MCVCVMHVTAFTSPDIWGRALNGFAETAGENSPDAHSVSICLGWPGPMTCVVSERNRTRKPFVLIDSHLVPSFYFPSETHCIPMMPTLPENSETPSLSVNVEWMDGLVHECRMDG